MKGDYDFYYVYMHSITGFRYGHYRESYVGQRIAPCSRLKALPGHYHTLTVL